jgi:hypothetical protein
VVASIAVVDRNILIPKFQEGRMLGFEPFDLAQHGVCSAINNRFLEFLVEENQDREVGSM